jgi:hypothetical protein
MADYKSVSEALKLVSPFKGDKKEVLAFIPNVDTDFEGKNPYNSDVLYKFVIKRISGEPRVAKTHRNLENWEHLGLFLKNTYTEKRRLDFSATQFFGRNRAKIIIFQIGSRTFRRSAQNLGRQPLKTAKTMNG